MANDLQSFQRTIARALIALCFAHVPVLLAVAALRDRNFVAIAGLALLLAAAPAVFYRLRRPIVAVALLLGIALVGQTSLLVYTMRGHAWQVEMHFYYFAVLAFLLGLCDWRVLVFTAALIAMHHLSLNTVLPAAIYPSGTDFGRAAVHAIVVVAETAMLVVICLALRNAFGRAEVARQTAEQAAADLAQAGALRETMLTETTARAEDTRALLERFEGEMSSSIDTLHAAAEALLGSANHLGVSSERTSAQVVAVSTATDDTARKVELAAQGGEELAATINDIGTSAAQSSKLAATVVREAEQTNATIQEMAVVADEIGEVTSLITGIAAQTNLLALNATIEAARAGEAGRGFSVVAQEVKALSSQTARATQEIATRIAALQGATGRSVAAIGAISARIRELDSVAASIAEAVGHQALATSDIAANVASASNGVGDVEKAIGEIESLVGANTRSVGQMSDAAHQIVRQTKTIRERVRLFTGDVARMRA